MNKKHTEIKFEDALEYQLLSLEGGFWQGNATQFDKSRAMDTVLLIGFIKATQEKHWQALQAIHQERVEKVILDDLEKEINAKGLLAVLRHGFKCFGRILHVAYFTPNNGLNPQTLADYWQNHLTITRQLHYSWKDPKKSLCELQIHFPYNKFYKEKSFTLILKYTYNKILPIFSLFPQVAMELKT
ncbi:MAG: hypothetical protein D4R94_05465 [Chitinophagaceae bacterium]|nr:MAG: hypothetical protein D4R94_05465 [Chitinophagaceae bacterium]